MISEDGVVLCIERKFGMEVALLRNRTRANEIVLLAHHYQNLGDRLKCKSILLNFLNPLLVQLLQNVRPSIALYCVFY